MIKSVSVFGKIVILTSFLLVCLLFFIYRHRPALPDQVKIGASYMTMNNDFYQYLNAEVEKVIDEHGDQLYTRDPALNIDKQVEQIDFFIEEKMDVIIINPVDGNSQKIIQALKRAKKAKIKLIVVDSQLKDASFVDTTIVSDNYQAGVLSAQDLLAQRQSAKILLLEHDNALSAIDRIQGFLDTIANQDNFEIVARTNSLGQTEIAMPQVSQIIADGIDFDTVMSLNDRAAIGALAALKSSDRAHDLPLIYGIDGSPDMKSLLATTSDIEATVAQSPYNMGQEVTKALYQLSQGKTYQKQVTIAVRLIKQDNVSDYNLAGWQ